MFQPVYDLLTKKQRYVNGVYIISTSRKTSAML